MAGFRVIIVGGGIGGLTLANCLQHAGIDFLLLEGREEIGLHVGAGVGIEPNGDRILDQLGVRSDLESELVANRCFIFRDITGKLMYERDGPQLVTQRTGYFSWCYDRRIVLEALYNRIWEKERVLVRKRVQHVDYEGSRPVVRCTDNSEYQGDIVVGSDGVNSAVRREMWRLASEGGHGSIPAIDAHYISSEYRGLYGISDPIEGIEPGTMTLIVGVGQVCYWMAGKRGQSYWCLVEKLPEKLHFPNIPKYTDAEAVAYAEERLGKPLLSDNTVQVTFGDLWAKRKAYALVNVEEGNMNLWTAGRIVCIGDIVHKMTPESGQGANQAIETAASLANHLKHMMDGCSEDGPSSDEIETCLRDFQAHRQPSARKVVQLTNRNVRLFSFDTPLLKFALERLSPIMGDVSTNQMCDRYIGSVRVEYLPIPARSIKGTMPFNPTQGVTRYESRKRRAAFGLPLLSLAIFSLFIKEESVPMLQILEAPVYLIFVLEGCRRANSLKPITWLDRPHKLQDASAHSDRILLFGILSRAYGVALWGNIWFYLHYIWSPIEIYGPSDQRLLQMNYARTALPLMVLTCLLPIFAIISNLEVPLANDLLSLWSWMPVLLPLCHRILAACVQDTTPNDRLHNVKADLPFIRPTIIATAFVSFISFQYLKYGMGEERFSLLYLIKPATTDPRSLCLQLGATLWVLLLFGDLKSAGMAKQKWVTMLAFITPGIVFLGPGTTLLACWLWREEAIATRRHREAITH